MAVAQDHWVGIPFEYTFHFVVNLKLSLMFRQQNGLKLMVEKFHQIHSRKEITQSVEYIIKVDYM